MPLAARPGFSIAAAVVCATAFALGGCAKPVPAERLAYVGEWTAPVMELEIGSDGQVEYHRHQDGWNRSISAPLKEFDGNDFIVGMGPFTTRFVVSMPPHLDGTSWKITVDGVELTRVTSGGVAGGI